MLLERYIDFLADNSSKRLGRVSFESQGPKEDAEHQLESPLTAHNGYRHLPYLGVGLKLGCDLFPKLVLILPNSLTCSRETSMSGLETDVRRILSIGVHSRRRSTVEEMGPRGSLE